MRDPKERLLDILEAIERIERYSILGREEFERNELIQIWIVHYLQIIGECASKLGRYYHEDHPQLPWSQIVAMRNILVHEYFGVDLKELWNVVNNELPGFKKVIESLLKDF